MARLGWDAECWCEAGERFRAAFCSVGAESSETGSISMRGVSETRVLDYPLSRRGPRYFSRGDDRRTLEPVRLPWCVETVETKLIKIATRRPSWLENPRIGSRSDELRWRSGLGADTKPLDELHPRLKVSVKAHTRNKVATLCPSCLLNLCFSSVLGLQFSVAPVMPF